MARPDIEDAFHGSVTVGERGQVVIPAVVRELIGVTPGEKLLVFAHPSGMGVLFMKLEGLQDLVDRFTPLIREAQSAGAEPQKVVEDSAEDR